MDNNSKFWLIDFSDIADCDSKHLLLNVNIYIEIIFMVFVAYLFLFFNYKLIKYIRKSLTSTAKIKINK